MHKLSAQNTWNSDARWRGFFRILRGKTSISDITKVVSYNDINWNPKQEIPILNAEISHIYMWKMNEEEIWIYSDDFLKWILQYYFYCTPQSEKVTLELANCVSEVLWENMQWFMNFKKQKEYIQDFVEKNFSRKDAQRLEIIDLESRHPELFTQLRKHEKKIKTEAVEKWLSIWELDQTPSFDKFEFLDSDKAPKLPDYEFSFSSLDIAKYLYRVCKNNALFFDKIKAIKPEKAKSEFYPLIEISIRLTDFLNWVNIQWWAIKQKNYDAIIREIINPYKNISQYPEIAQLREFCKQRIWERSFETIYMDGNSKKYRAFTEKIEWEKHETSTRRRILWFSSWMLLSALMIYWQVYMHQRQKLQKQTQETIKEIFENRKVTRSWDMWWWEYEWNQKIEQVNTYIQTIYDRFIFRYGSIWKFSEEGFKSKIIDCLNDQEVLNLLWNYRWYDNMVTEDNIIDNYLIPRNIWEFRMSWINTTPYSKYLKYTDAFVNTILLQEDWETNRDESIKTAWYRWMYNNMKVVDEIWAYWAKEQWMYSSIVYVYQLAKVQRWWKLYILATWSPCFQNFKKSENYELYTYRWRELAIDFLKQTYPIVNELMDQYLLRYYKRYSNSWDLNWYYKESIPWDIQLLILRDFLSKWLLKKIDKKQTDKIVSYLDEFVIQNQDKLKKIQSGISPDLIPINPSLTPNGILEPYEQAMKNIIEDKEKVFNGNARLPVSRRSTDDKEKIVSPLWKYRASDGKMYLVWKVKIDWKEYLYAEEEWRLYKDKNEYGVYYWEIVAKDYFKTKSDFLQKKLLYEKKLKSASQKHINVNEKSKPDTYSNYTKNNPKGIVTR